MLRFRKSTTTATARRYREWTGWDIVLRLEQREGDRDAAFYFQSFAHCEVDWGDGTPNATVTPGTIYHAYAVGEHIAKIRLPQSTATGRSIVFGAGNNNRATLARMPQIVEVLKLDMGRGRTMRNMFCKCGRIRKVCKVSHAGGIVDAAYAYYTCPNLAGAAVFDSLAECTSVDAIFTRCGHLERAWLGDMPENAALSNAFYGCLQLRRARLGESGLVRSAASAFQNCLVLNDLTIGLMPSCTSLQNAFSFCRELVSVELGDLPQCSSLYGAFWGCTSLRHAGVYSIPKCNNISNAFNACINLAEITLTDLDAVVNASACYCRTAVTEVEISSMERCTTLSEAFRYCENLRKIKLPDLPSCTSISGVCCYDYALEEAEVGDLPQCTSLASAFSFASRLRSVRLGAVGGANATMASFVQYCDGLETAEIGPTTATYWNNAFSYCRTLRHLRLDCLNAILQCSGAFQYCCLLERLEGTFRLAPTGPTQQPSYFNTIFGGCGALLEMPDIWPEEGFTTPTLANAQLTNVFSECINLKGHAPEWLWDASDARHWRGTGGHSAFSNCFGLDNFEEIPSDWGGSQLF